MRIQKTLWTIAMSPAATAARAAEAATEPPPTWPWPGPTRARDLLAVGLLWLVLTLGFEILVGRLVVGASWERLAADYNVLEGGLLPFGMLVLLLSPLIAGRLRRRVPTS